jgi:Protein of unknown function (DUF1524)
MHTRIQHVIAIIGIASAVVSCTGSPSRVPARQLDQLLVRAEDTGAHYRRADWGDWASHGRGCDTREVVLLEQGVGVVAGKDCRPSCPTLTPRTPCWVSPYDGARLQDPAGVQVDHLVPVKEAVRSGARGWDRALRQRFYNDPINLFAVSAHANTSKGDRDPGRWRPSNRDSWCVYATGYIAVKRGYGLSVDQRERDALLQMVGTCREVSGG